MFFRKGSTMVMVISTIGILTILGLSITTMAAVNFKYRKIDETRKKSYYSAEAGFDQAYAFVAKQIEEAIKTGTENVKVETDLTKAQYHAEYEASIASGTAATNAFVNADGTFKEEAFEQEYQKWFEAGYNRYLNEQVPIPDTVNKGSISVALSNKTYEKVNATYLAPPTVTVLDTAKLLEGQADGEYEKNNYALQIPIQSEFSLENSGTTITRKLASDLEVRVPKFVDVSNANVKKLEVEAEQFPLLYKSLVADGYVSILNGSANINGTLHAYEGVNLSGNLTVKEGIVATTGDVKLNNNVSFTTDFSNVYCKNLEIPQGKSNCQIDIKGNVNTLDDIEFNGSSSKLNIRGSYYGFSDGSTYSTHDRSSSLVINSPDIGSNSEIKIDGAEVVDSGGKCGVEQAPSSSDVGVYIYGTVYIGNEAAYQTGESVSIKGNYKAYNARLEKQTDDNAKYNATNIEFTYQNPLLVATHFLNPTEALNARDKAKYIELYQQEIGGLKLGNGNIKLSNVEHSLGAYMNNNSFYNDKGGSGESSLPIRKLNMYRLHTNLLGDPRISFINGNSEIASFKNQTTVSELVDLNQAVDYKLADRSANTVKRVIYNSDASKTLVIKGLNGTVPSGNVEVINVNDNALSANNKNIQGAIFTAGDVYITGEVDYIGVIAAGGNIILDDATSKNFVSNAKVAENCIFQAEIEEDVLPLTYFNRFKRVNVLSSDVGTKINVAPAYDKPTHLYNADISVGGVTNYSTVGALAVFKNMKRVN